MSMQISINWKSTSRKISSRIEAGRLKVLTLDVFDTLLLRRTNPDFVLHAVCQLVAADLHIDAVEVEKARHRAWRLEAAQAVSAGLDEDARVRALFRRWMDLLAGDRLSDIELADLSDWCLRCELDIEEECLAANTVMLDAVRKAKAAGIRVVAISDMYLSSVDLRDLLGRFGFGGLIDDVVTSGDKLLQKKTGRLFARCLEDGSIFGDLPRDLGTLLHVGDDAIADGLMARRNGIESIVAYDLGLMRHKNVQHYAGQVPRSVTAANAAAFLAEPKDTAEELGFARFGPIYSGFIHAVARQACDDQVGSVWFMAREGWLLGELYQMAVESGLGDPRIQWGYLYASRLATMRAQFTRFSDHEIGSILSNTGDMTVSKILAPLRLSSSQQAAMLENVGLRPDSAATPGRLVDLLTSTQFIEAVTMIGHSEREGLRQYLELTGFPSSGRVAVVDVGWGGQIQENLCRSLALLGSKVAVVGYYLGTDARADERRARGLVMKALVVDSERNDGNGRGAFSFVQGLELATRSPHGSVVGYNPQAGLPVLVGDDEPGRIAEKVDDPDIAAMQQGILRFSAKYLKLAGHARLSPDESVRLSRDAIDLLSLIPARRHAALLLKFNNVANLGMDEGSRLGGQGSLLRPKELVRTLRKTLWKQGTLAACLPFLGPFAFLSYKLLRSKLSTRCQSVSLVDMLIAPSAGCDVAAPAERPEIVRDVLKLDISQLRAIAAAEVRNGDVQGRNLVFGLRDALTLKIIKKMGRAADQGTTIKVNAKSLIKLVAKHPLVDVARHVLRHR